MRKNIKKKQMRVGAYILTAAMVAGMFSGCSEGEEKSAPGKKAEQETTSNTEKTTDADDIEIQTAKDEADFPYMLLKMADKGNMVYSPLSVSYALNMLKEGADGNTRVQIENVIGEVSPGKYDNIEEVLSLANAVYIRDSFSEYVKDEYKDILSANYNAEVIYDAFANANNINSWIENKTFDQIKDMLNDDVVSNPQNVMMLVNALAMNMEWKEKFDEAGTRQGTFYLEDGNEMEAAVMHRLADGDDVSYYIDEDVTALTMDLKEYGDEQMQFLAIMPNENLTEYTQSFDNETLKSITEKLIPASDTNVGVKISVPKFSIDYNINLKEQLKSLGITDAFDPNLADFKNITDQYSFFAGEVIHQAKIDFSEKGIKAAAATVIMIENSMEIVTEQPVAINIDKPFMYLIRDKKTGEIWFAGTVYEPDLWENVKGDYIYE